MPKLERQDGHQARLRAFGHPLHQAPARTSGNIIVVHKVYKVRGWSFTLYGLYGLSTFNSSETPMSGHSKWSQIKHKKALTDAKKAKIFSKMARLIGVAVKEKGPDPDKNPTLRLTVERARAANMPNDNIQRIIKKYSGNGAQEKFEEIIFEGYGPGGVALIIETHNDSRNRISQEIRHILSSHGGNLAAPGSVLWSFEKIKTESADGGPSFEYTAKYPAIIEDREIKEKLEALFEALDDNDDVQEIYSNL